MQINMKKINIVFDFFLMGIALIFSIYAMVDEKNYKLLLLGAILFWLSNIIYTFVKFKERSLYFFFHLTFFVFLLGRPSITILRGDDLEKITQTNYSQSANIWLGILLIFVALVGNRIGAMLGDLLNEKVFCSKKKMITSSGSFLLFNLKWISLILFCISVMANIILEAEKVDFIIKHSYVAYYVLFKSKLPYLIYVVSTFMEPALCCFLITYPPKKQSYIVLVLYIGTTVLSLIGGERNPFVLAVLFALLYFIYRDYIGDKKKWIGKFETICLLVATPIGLIVLGLMNYIRDNVSSGMSNVTEILVDLLYKQGVTFSWYCSGLGILKQLPGITSSNYTFGGFIDYFKYGSLGQIFFGMEGLGNVNSLRRAMTGNSMAHQLSYTLLGNSYLQGHGCGSCYLLEVYADYGIAGIFIFSILLGIVLVCAFSIARRSVIGGVIMLLAITGILFMPRAEAMGGIKFIFRMPFWCTFIVCMVGSSLFTRKYKRRFVR